MAVAILGGRNLVGAIGSVGAAGFVAELVGVVGQWAIYARSGPPPAIVAGGSPPGQTYVAPDVAWIESAELASFLLAGAGGGFAGAILASAFLTRGRWLVGALSCGVAALAPGEGAQRLFAPLLYLGQSSQWMAIVGAVCGGVLGMWAGRGLRSVRAA